MKKTEDNGIWNDKEIDEKLYRVARKKGSHINTKENPDGSRSAIQFSDDSNGLTGPVDIIEVKEDELLGREYIKFESSPRTFRSIILEDVIAPIAHDILEQALETGFYCFEQWMINSIVPKTKHKTREIGENIKLILSTAKDGIATKETKSFHIIKGHEEKKKSELSSSVDNKVYVKNRSTAKKDIHSKEEIQEIMDIMRSSAITLAACIRWVNNAVMEDDGTNPEKRLEIQRNLEELSSADVMRQIDLLLEDKNHDLLNQASLRILAAFREGNLIINGETLPIRNYLPEEK